MGAQRDEPDSGPSPSVEPSAQPDEVSQATQDRPEHEDHESRLHLPALHPPALIEPDEDRWRWRAKIRRDPRQLFFYRIGVGIAGLVLMIAAIITGPLPGPGGIPLFLLGLAVWSSE
ncbi:MAG: hypothetical protein Q4G46_04405, partial [Propionibacteriaceae bacterium]|nr:hypothetical protein [Propionibacteriaceae bacterium]